MQLKHASRYVHDLLTVLTKHMDMPSILYLLDLVSTLPPNAHTRQTLYLASLLIRIVWRAGLSSGVADAAPVTHTTSPVHGPLTSSKALSNFCLNQTSKKLLSKRINMHIKQFGKVDAFQDVVCSYC